MLGRFGCPLCNGTGTITNELGLEEECSCVREMTEEERSSSSAISVNTIVQPNLFGELSVNDKIIRMKLVPESRINDLFDEKHVRIVALQMCAIMKAKISKESISEYTSTLDTILTGLRARKLPKHSYIIGATNGFGKTTFANTAIKIMASNGMKAVPYISLIELAEKWATANETLARRIENKSVALRTVKDAEDDDDGSTYKSEYDWYDYVNADLAIVSLTSINEETMWIETQTLRALLEIRSRKDLATIVLTSESLDWYFNSERVGKYMMSQIIEAQATEKSKEKKEFGDKNDLAYETVENRLDKLTHISTFLTQLKA